MCLDRRTLRSVAAHKGWETRRAREGLELIRAHAPVEGGKPIGTSSDRSISSEPRLRARILECL